MTVPHITMNLQLGLQLAVFALQLILAFFTIRQYQAARYERVQAEVARQRSDVTCAGITSILREMGEADLCRFLWAHHFRHAGFAFEKTLYAPLPEYLRRQCDPFIEDIKAPIPLDQHETARFLLVFRFPYPRFDAVLDDVNRLNFGNIHLVWDDDGKPMKVVRK
jgi:hypothetical protein